MHRSRRCPGDCAPMPSCLPPPCPCRMLSCPPKIFIRNCSAILSHRPCRLLLHRSTGVLCRCAQTRRRMCACTHTRARARIHTPTRVRTLVPFSYLSGVRQHQAHTSSRIKMVSTRTCRLRRTTRVAPDNPAFLNNQKRVQLLPLPHPGLLLLACTLALETHISKLNNV